MAEETQGDSADAVEKATDAGDGHQHAEALTNGIYGTIVMAAFFAAVEAFEESAAVLLGELLFATLVLFVAHLFASWI